MDAKEVEEILQKTSKARLGYEMRWYIVDRFLDGVHFDRIAKVDENGNISLVKPTFAKGINPIPIPRAEKQIESVLNLLFFNKPIWKFYPLPEKINEFYIKLADKMNSTMESLYDTLEIQNKVKKAVAGALKYKVAYLEAGIDREDNLFVEEWDPWNIYHDLNIETLEQTRFLIKVVKKTKEELMMNEFYNQDVVKNLQTERRESYSDYMEQRIKEKFYDQITFSDEKKNFVLIKEVWFRDGNRWFMGTVADGKWLREPVEVDYFPFVAITFEEGHSLYGTSLVEKLIPLNREIDLVMAYIKHFVYTTSQGKLLEPKGSKIERILDQHGERIRYEGGREPKWLDIPPLSPAVMAYLNSLITFMDERGIAVLSFGKLPSKKLGWQALESLKQIELGNMQNYVEKISEILKKLGYKILEIIEKTYVDKFLLLPGEEEPLKLISEDAYYFHPEWQEDKNVIPITSKWGIKIEIESGLAYTEEGKIQRLLELYKMGIVTAEEVREKLKLGPSPLKEAEKAMETQLGSQLNVENLPLTEEIQNASEI